MSLRKKRTFFFNVRKKFPMPRGPAKGLSGRAINKITFFLFAASLINRLIPTFHRNCAKYVILYYYYLIIGIIIINTMRGEYNLVDTDIWGIHFSL